LPQISAKELYIWRQQAMAVAIASTVEQTEIDWLIQEIGGKDRLSLSLLSPQQQKLIDLKQPLSAIDQLWQRRIQERLPIQYLLGYTHWRHFTLKVTPDVLIPRPETELIIDIALQALQQSPNPQLNLGNWVDLGTGSGAIALGLTDLLTNATIYAIDTSKAALAIAQDNAINTGLASKIKFDQGNWWQPIEHLQGKISAMVSNPPYIPTATIPTLQKEVANHEPHLALDGGKDGLEHIRYLIKTAPAYLVSGGIWLIEMMAGQAETVTKLLQEQGNYQNIQIFSDLAGIDRFALAYRC